MRLLHQEVPHRTHHSTTDGEENPSQEASVHQCQKEIECPALRVGPPFAREILYQKEMKRTQQRVLERRLEELRRVVEGKEQVVRKLREAAGEKVAVRRFVGLRKSKGGEQQQQQQGQEGSELVIAVRKSRVPMRTQIPIEILENEEINVAMKQLPSNYNLEVHKTIWRLREAKVKRLALQFPEGLLLFSCVLSDIFEKFVPTIEVVHIMADVTYGACCVDDFGARALDCDFMVHYGHSCLIPIDVTASSSSLKLMYVFVEIQIDVDHLVGSVLLTFSSHQNESSTKGKLALMGTIQFVNALHAAKLKLEQESAFPLDIVVPQEKPLSHGEVLGCTSPTFPSDVAAMVFVADGRFHLESAMIANPDVPAYRYDPYARVLTQEAYDTPLLHETRKHAIEVARKAKKWGIVFGTLGRQGNPDIVNRLLAALEKQEHVEQPPLLILLSELLPEKLALFDQHVDTWVQVACPRLSIDWGTFFTKPLLSPYEAFCALNLTDYHSVYPQDFYSRKPDAGPWTNYFSSKT